MNNLAEELRKPVVKKEKKKSKEEKFIQDLKTIFGQQI